MPYRVLIPEDITDAGKRYLLDRGYQIKMGTGSSEEQICRDVADCDAILARTAVYTRKILEAGKKLKVIGRHGVGTDNIDLAAATELGIQVTNAPDSNANSVAEHTIALILACASHLVSMDRYCRRGLWQNRTGLTTTEVRGKTLGIVGVGKTGRLVAEMAMNGLGMDVVAYNHRPKPLPPGIQPAKSMEGVFSSADFVSLHIPATPQTVDSVGRSLFRLMKSSAFFINCSRGRIVREQDLYTALSEHWIQGAALDVFRREPPGPDNPLFALDNIIVSPHNAGLSDAAQDRMGLDAARGIDEVLSGRAPTWPVNRPAARRE